MKHQMKLTLLVAHWLDGVGGEDFIVGGSDADVLVGGADADLLIGGAGNDNIWGDTTANAVYLDWTLTRQVEEQGCVTRYRSVFTNADLLTAAGSDDLLFGGAGDGGDETPLHLRSNSNTFAWRMAA